MPTRKQILSQLSAPELRKRLAWKCPLKGHSGHDGITHSACYDKLHGTQSEEKICFLDIEGEGLVADYAIMFCWVLQDAQTGKMYHDIINSNDIKKYTSHKREVHPKEDTRIVQSLVNKLSEYDRVVAHFIWYDLPFARTRAVICGIDFPNCGAMYQGDTWRMLKNKFKLSRNSLLNATTHLLGGSRKDHLSLSIKHGCIRGEKWALDDTLAHCKKDVLDLRDLYNKISFSVKNTKTSI
jgi:hypothetical protein